MERIVQDQRNQLQKWAKEFPAFTVCSDNANWKEHKRDQRLDNQSEMRNMMMAYIFKNRWTAREKMLTMDNAFQPLNVVLRSLTSLDFIPSDEDSRHNQRIFQASLYNTLLKYCGAHMRKLDSSGKPEEPFVVPQICQLPVGKPTKVHGLPAYNKNEVKTRELNDVVKGIMDNELGYAVKELENKGITFTGDLYTINLLRYVHPHRHIYRLLNRRNLVQVVRNDHPKYFLDFVIPIAGMFHLQMAMLNVITQAHWGCDDKFMGISGWVKWLRPDSYIFKATPKRRKHVVKDFRACHDLLNHVLDGHIIALIAAEVGVKDVSSLCEILEKQNISWRKAIKNGQIKYSSPSFVDELRKLPLEQRDVPYENGILFVQHGILYRDFVLAMRTGDVGRIEYCLRMFTVLFQASNSHLYARELLHLMGSIKYRWTPEFHQYWQETLLVNVSGSQKGFMAADLLNEWLVREFKRNIRSTSHGKGFNYVLETLTPLSFTSRNCRKQMVKDTGATYYYKHSVMVSAWADVKSVANRLLQTRVFEQTRGRLVADARVVQVAVDLNSSKSKWTAQIAQLEAIDLWCKGIANLLSGAPIDKYKAWLLQSIETMEENEDEDEGDSEVEDSEAVSKSMDSDGSSNDASQFLEFIDDDDDWSSQ